MTNRKWEYPLVSMYYSAMADFASCEANLPYFLERAAERMTVRSFDLARHNLTRYAESQANAIGFASRD